MDRVDRVLFEKDLTELINRFSLEGESNTPDFIIARYLVDCLENYNNTIRHRASWYGRMDTPAQGSIPFKK